MRIGVFVNVTNQFYAVLAGFPNHTNPRIDYQKYLNIAVGDGILYRAFAYGVTVQDEALPFIATLRRIGFEVKYRQARIIKNSPSIRQTDVNVGMVVDVARLTDRIDCAVIGSNDPDLVPLIMFLRERGVKSVIFGCKIPPELHDIADFVIEVTEDMLEVRD